MPSSLSSQQIATGPRILVVSDDQDMHKLLNFFITQAGYQVISASHTEAISIYQTQEIDLVLLDLMLAPTTGYHFCQQLRRHSDVPLILLAALNQPEQIVGGLELGADDAIYYPFAMVELIARMRALLRRQQWIGTTGFRLAGKKTSEADATPNPIWVGESPSWNQSSSISGM
ncbi:MAG: response regulator transcription factor [Caldilineaceae bacterium]|nr:response regulator transcription factor [Caldilineaceae bacterium]